MACISRRLRSASYRPVPRLVFLNCCHLGVVDTTATAEAQVRAAGALGDFHRFASSIAEQLIKDGVQAVIAAGWAVDDRAALEFASSLYDQMLNKGTPFGDAVRISRQRTRERFPGTNTWGAYQCYGDPGLTLAHGGSDDGHDRSLVAAAEMKRRAERLALDARDPRSRDSDVVENLDRLVEQNPDRWIDGELSYLLGRAYSEAGEFAKAIKRYRAARKQWTADAPLSMLEQLANLLGRHAEEKLHPERDQPQINKQLTEAEQLLKALFEVGETPERPFAHGQPFQAQGAARRRTDEEPGAGPSPLPGRRSA